MPLTRTKTQTAQGFDLAASACQPCHSDTTALTDAEADQLMPALAGWQRVGNRLEKTYRFANYHETMAFVNAAAWISHRENHHPDLAVAYQQCTVSYTTHALGGLSINDFICAAKIEALTP